MQEGTVYCMTHETLLCASLAARIRSADRGTLGSGGIVGDRLSARACARPCR